MEIAGCRAEKRDCANVVNNDRQALLTVIVVVYGCRMHMRASMLWAFAHQEPSNSNSDQDPNSIKFSVYKLLCYRFKSRCQSKLRKLGNQHFWQSKWRISCLQIPVYFSHIVRKYIRYKQRPFLKYSLNNLCTPLE